MYNHPGHLFLEHHSKVQTIDDVLAYVSFLRRRANLDDFSPANLPVIYEHFGIPTPKRAALPNQQGLLLIPEIGLILINQDDVETRQRFTEAHELMELLFNALPDGRGWAVRQKGPFKHATKEWLCNRGAADLLMPPKVFETRAREEGVSFNTAQKLSRAFGVSSTAALVQLARLAASPHVVVLWRMKHKKADEAQKNHPSQLSLFGEIPNDGPAKKLRVEWVLRGPNGFLIPQNKSVPEQSIIFAAWQGGQFTSGEEGLDLGAAQGLFRSENLPFEAEGGERRVLSLLEWLK
jgi:Zn-dependent peptidase ImmA (M78 family)